jgi:hypothetical protein
MYGVVRVGFSHPGSAVRGHGDADPVLLGERLRRLRRTMLAHLGRGLRGRRWSLPVAGPGWEHQSHVPTLSGVVINALLPKPWEHRGAVGEQATVFNGVERLPMASNGRPVTCGFRVSAGRRPGLDRFDTEEVTGSNPVSPTSETAGQRLVTEDAVTDPFVCVAYTWRQRGSTRSFARFAS